VPPECVFDKKQSTEIFNFWLKIGPEALPIRKQPGGTSIWVKF